MNYIKLLLISSLAIILFSCSKNEPLSMRWDLTGCSNPWDSYFSLDTFSTEAYYAGIFDYLSEEGIDVNFISSEFDSTKVELCYACHCKTGKVFELIVSKNDKRKMKNLGLNQFDLHFYQ